MGDPVVSPDGRTLGVIIFLSRDPSRFAVLDAQTGEELLVRVLEHPGPPALLIVERAAG
jgi:hypothetical protein